MSFIALGICGGRFAKGCCIMGVILHALPGDARYLPFSDNAAVERWVPSSNGLSHDFS
jgi:hypothetical protein